MRRVLSLLLLAAASGFAGTPVFNGDFSNSKDWTVLKGIAFPDPSSQREGRKSLVIQPEQSGSDGMVQSAPMPLVIGKRYELGGYIRSENLEVQETGRSPIVVGASLSMASMPFDMHSESVAGTHDWTRLRLRFTATRTEDRILLKVADGGAFRGKAWFDGISIEEISNEDAAPAKSSVHTYGPAYRYPQGGWIYLHVQGEPYERGYQHGTLMAKEIPLYLERCAANYDPQWKDWKAARNTADAIFLRGFDAEILQEMKGIADGASDAGAKWQGRRIELLDVVTANVIVEMGELRAALSMTPNGLEALHLKAPQYSNKMAITERCSAFAATGKATRDGKMVIAHTTFWPLTLAEQTNVMLDVQPASGHRILMQSYPGGIESGTDWYQNDSGVVLTETTIRQSPFNPDGTPIAYRARKAIQYADNIDKVVEILSTKNNGLYTNEWLIGDAKTDEIAMFELGTRHNKLWRSSKDEWFGGTEGFYWGCNNAKDLAVRLELKPDPQSSPEHIPYVPSDRDLKWQELYEQHKGKIDEQFGFLAFRTAPLVSSAAMDAKVVTSSMASKLMLWAVFGKPNEREWVPADWQKREYSKNEGLYSGGYRLVSAEVGRDFPQLETKPVEHPERLRHDPESFSPKRWKGWILPATNADTWLSAGSAAYYSDLESGDLDRAVAAHWAGYRAAKMAEPRTDINRFDLEKHRGAILLDSLRRGLGNDRFFDLMTQFFAANTTKAVSAQAFLDEAGTTATMPPDKGGPLYLVRDISTRLKNAWIVYGTVMEASANRYAAEQLQKHFLDYYEDALPIRKDFEASDAELQEHDIIFVGRPETNSALAGFRYRLNLSYEGAAFKMNGREHGNENDGLMLAASNPLNEQRMVVVLAGNSPLETVRLTAQRAGRVEYAIFEGETSLESGFRANTVAIASPPGFAPR